MGIYNFVDTTEKITVNKHINSESPKIVNWQNSYLEDLVNGFTILSVTGRELVPKTIIANVNVNTDGQHYFASKYEPRELEFTYQIIAENAYTLMKEYKKLNYYLTGVNELTFSFQDELLFYTGTVTGIGDVSAGTNRHVATFTVTCSDPYKYTEPKSLTSSGFIKVSRSESSFTTAIDSVKITVSNVSTVDFTLKGSNKSYNTDSIEETYNVIFNKDKLKIGDVIILDVKNGSTYLNNVQNDSVIHWSSDFENIGTFAEYYLTFNGNSSEVIYRNRFI